MSDLALTAAGRLPTVSANDAERLRTAAQQFEATFLQELLRPLSDSPVDDQPLLGGSSAAAQFKSLYHQGLSEQIAGGLGIAELVFHELSIRAGLPGARDPRTTP
jgi:Rod binding domain-containing protein